MSDSRRSRRQYQSVNSGALLSPFLDNRNSAENLLDNLTDSGLCGTLIIDELISVPAMVTTSGHVANHYSGVIDMASLARSPLESNQYCRRDKAKALRQQIDDRLDLLAKVSRGPLRNWKPNPLPTSSVLTSVWTWKSEHPAILPYGMVTPRL